MKRLVRGEPVIEKCIFVTRNHFKIKDFFINYYLKLLKNLNCKGMNNFLQWDVVGLNNVVPLPYRKRW